MTDRIIFALIVVLAAVYFYATAQIPTLEIGDPLGPKAFPRLLGIGLLITAALLFMEMWRARKNQPEKDAGAQTGDRRHLLIVAGAAVWTGIYFAVFEPLGYVLSTTIYLLALTAYFHRGKWITNIVTSVLYGVLSYVLFSTALGVSLPRGVLPF
jgi:putative tricarboxylic transport membrane protein